MCTDHMPRAGSSAFMCPRGSGHCHLLKVVTLGTPWWSSDENFSFQCGGMGPIPGQRAKMPCASQPKNKNIKQKQYCNKFNKDF